MMRSNVQAMLWAIACLSVSIAFPASADPERTEFEVKAALLVKFAEYTDWPEAGTPICIGVLGEDPFGKDLDEAVAGKVIQSPAGQKRTLTIKRSKNVTDLKSCDVLFIGKSEKDQLPQIFKTLGNSTILTVGDTDGFCKRRGIINFILKDGKIKYEINKKGVKRCDLKPKSGLLKAGIEANEED